MGGMGGMRGMERFMKPQPIDNNSYDEEEIVVELWGHLLPQAVENFRVMTTGEKGIGYEGKQFIQKVWQQPWGSALVGGDLGGKSIYGGTFPNEAVYHQFSEPGLIACYNNGKDGNSSAFMINISPIDPEAQIHMKFQVIGRVLKGMNFLIEQIQRYGWNKNGEPNFPVTVTNSKELT